MIPAIAPTVTSTHWVDLADQLQNWKQHSQDKWRDSDDFDKAILICRDFDKLVKTMASTPSGLYLGDWLPYAVAFILLGPEEIFQTQTAIHGIPTNWIVFAGAIQPLTISSFKPAATGVPQAVEVVAGFGLGWQRKPVSKETDPPGWDKLWSLAGALAALKHIQPHLEDVVAWVSQLIGHKKGTLSKQDWRNTAMMYALMEFPGEIAKWDPAQGNLQTYFWSCFVGAQGKSNIKILNKSGFLMEVLETNSIATRGASTSNKDLQAGTCPQLAHVEGLPKDQTSDLLHKYSLGSDELLHCKTCNSFYQVDEKGKSPQLDGCSIKSLSQRPTKIYFCSQEYVDQWTRQYKPDRSLSKQKPGSSDGS